MGKRLVRTEQAIGEVVDGELVLLNVETGVYFGLNRTGTKVWELLGERSDVDDVLSALERAYPVERETLRRDLDALIADLEKSGLVRELGAR
jgi:hypothetical protein